MSDKLTIPRRNVRTIVAYVREPTADGRGHLSRAIHGTADFEITVNLDLILDVWARRAVKSKRRRSGFGSGAVVVKATRVTPDGES